MKHRFGRRFTSLLVASAMLLPFASCLTACGGGEQTATGNGFASVSEATVTDEYAVNGLKKEIAYLLSLDEDRLLADFRDNAALDTKDADSYEGGWEGALIGGHTLGHYLSALAQAYANAGTSDADRAKLKTRIESMVSALEECQKAARSAGSKAGFLWGARLLNAENPEIQFDNVEQGRTNISTEAWVPWYTMHKILAGLIDVYNFTGNGTAKKVATDLGNWVYNRVSEWTEATRVTVLNIEYGGMNDALYNLYRITGDERHAIAAHKFDEDIPNPGRSTSLFEDILADGPDYLNNRHANTTIPKVIGALNRYLTLDGKTVEGEKVDASEMLTLAEKFWTRVVEHHSYVTGGNSEWEHFGRDDVLDAERTNANCETCNVYNMLKLSRMLFSVTKDKKYLDFYERAYYNAIWSSQNPETGMTTYFQPMATGYFKVYSTPESNFWCCTGSGMESFTKLNDSIYYLGEGETYVSMYLASELDAGGLKLTMDADLENSDSVTLRVESGKTDLKLRVPEWTGSFSVMVGGQAVSENISEGFFTVPVKGGDEVKITLEREVAAHGIADNPNVYAFTYGPFVLSAELGTANMTTTTTGVNVTVPQYTDLGGFSQNVKLASGSTESFMGSIGEHLIKGDDGKFRLGGTDQNLVYSYHFRQHSQRYGIYFNFLGNGEEAEDGAVYTFEKIDTVQPGYGQYENDDWHAMNDGGSVSSTTDEELATSRYATAGGSFTYRMAVKKGQTNHLVAYFAAGDADKSIVIQANGTVIYNKLLSYSGPEKMYEILIPIPDEIVAAAQSTTVGGETRDLITVTISGADGQQSARIGSFLYTALVTFREKQFAGARDEKVAYFVDCGDYGVDTVSAGDKFGKFNSVTEQLFGIDYATGMYWGLCDGSDPTQGTAGSASAAGGISSSNTWAMEQGNIADGAAKTVTNRYTKNQYENNVARKLEYLFELPDGDYTVEIFLLDPWSCSKDVTVSADGRAVLEHCETGKALTANVSVYGGFLKLDFTTADKCINLAYIKISF